VSPRRHKRAARLPHADPQPRPDGGVRRALLSLALDVARLHHPLPGEPAARLYRWLLDCALPVARYVLCALHVSERNNLLSSPSSLKWWRKPPLPKLSV